MSLFTKHLRCVKCYNVDNNKSVLMTDKAYRDLHEIVCSKCKNKWLICTIHDHRWSQRRYIKAENHVKCMHQNEIVSDVCNVVTNQKYINDDIDSEYEEVYNDDNITSSESVNTSKALDIVSEDNILQKFVDGHRKVSLKDYNEKVRRYICSESHNEGDGLKQIVSCAFAMNSNSDYSQISVNELKYHIKAAIFSCSLTSSQKANYGELCYLMLDTFMDNSKNNSKSLPTRIAVSSKELDRYYLKRSTSIVQNVPIPTITEFDNHAYVSIKEIVQYSLYFEIPLDGMLVKKTKVNYKQLISASSQLASTKIGNLIRSQVQNNADIPLNISPLIITIVLWSDDFEPNNVKQHRKSTWIKTITLSPPVGYQTSPAHTFVIALGPKESNHESINARIFSELNELQKPTYMYCKATNTNIPIVIKILAISADRPERSSLNCMLGHNGLSSRRWRFSAYINQNKLKSCIVCIKRRLQSINTAFDYNNKVCHLCCDWNYNHPSMKQIKPDNYPSNQHPDSPAPPLGREVLNIKYLRPIELSYQIMMDGVRFCFFNCYHGYWTKASAMVYLKSIGVNESYGNDFVYQKAIQCRTNDNIESSSLYEFLKFPSHWLHGISLDQCIDTPMHQIFQGVVKSVMEKTMSWLSQKNNSQYKAFGDYVNSTLDDISDLNVDWCRMEKFTKGRNYSLVGWQAEQYVAFTRCILVIYGAVRDIVGDNEVGINEHECMMQSLLCFISRLMCDDHIESSIILNYIKCFLSACDLFEDTAYIMHGDDAMWYSKGNFLSLLNLPSQVDKFGHIRLYWEGSRERSIQQIKPYLINMRHTPSYFKTKLTHMYVSQTLKTMHSELIDQFPNRSTYPNEQHYERYSSLKVYSYAEDIEQLVSYGKVLSVVYLSLNSNKPKFYICQRSQHPNKCILYKIDFLDETGFNKCGIWYAPIEICVVNIGNEMFQEEVNESSEIYGILCPCVSSNIHLKHTYSVICSNWKYRGKYDILSLPDISMNLFFSLL